MTTGIDSLFGPLSKSYCFYFYLITIFFVISLVLLVITTLFIGITKKKGFMFFLQIIPVAVLYGMMYLQNRLLYNMCSNSL